MYKLITGCCVMVLLVLMGGCGGASPKQDKETTTQVTEVPVVVDASEPPAEQEAKEVEAIAESVIITDEASDKVEIEAAPAPEPVTSTPIPEQRTVKTTPPTPPPAIKKDDPNYFVLTLVKKDASHPYYGFGDTEGFAIDGVQGKEFILRRGKTYTIEVRSNPQHDTYITRNEYGWGAGIVEHGVKGNFIYDGVITFSPDELTPDIVYYQCQNHKAMGARIFIIDKDSKADLERLRAKYGSIGVTDSEERVVSEEEVKQKISYASLMFISKASKRISASNHDQAKAMLNLAKEKYDSAQKALTDDNTNNAMALVDESIRLFNNASLLVPSESVLREKEARYNVLREELTSAIKSHAANYEKLVSQKGASAGVNFDDNKVNSLTSEAKSLAASKNYTGAIKLLEQAQNIVNIATSKMLDSLTIKYELDISTPEGEFKYEYDRYLGYEELIPVVIEEKKPSDGQLMLVNRSVEKAKSMKDAALDKADSADYTMAIRMMMDATKEIRRALRIMGVNQ